MKELGYENSVTESADYRTYRKNINLYRLRIANTSDLSDEQYQFLSITLVEAADGNQAYSMLQEEMLSVKKWNRNGFQNVRAAVSRSTA